MDRWRDKGKDEYMNGWVDGWMDGQMVGRMDSFTIKMLMKWSLSNGSTIYPSQHIGH